MRPRHREPPRDPPPSPKSPNLPFFRRAYLRGEPPSYPLHQHSGQAPEHLPAPPSATSSRRSSLPAPSRPAHCPGQAPCLGTSAKGSWTDAARWPPPARACSRCPILHGFPTDPGRHKALVPGSSIQGHAACGRIPALSLPPPPSPSPPLLRCKQHSLASPFAPVASSPRTLC